VKVRGTKARRPKLDLLQETELGGVCVVTPRQRSRNPAGGGEKGERRDLLAHCSKLSAPRERSSHTTAIDAAAHGCAGGPRTSLFGRPIKLCSFRSIKQTWDGGGDLSRTAKGETLQSSGERGNASSTYNLAHALSGGAAARGNQEMRARTGAGSAGRAKQWKRLRRRGVSEI